MGEVLQFVLLGNATLIVAFLCAWFLERTAILFRLRTAYRLRLHLAVAALCAASLPFLLSPFLPLLANLFSINGTDLLVSQYLKGNINVSATQFTEFLNAKNSVVETMLDGSTAISKIALLAIGVAALLRAAYIALNIVRIRRHLRTSTTCFSTRRVDVKISPYATVPFSTRGLFRYYILIPESLVHDGRAYRIALGHEAQHIRQGDVDWEVLLSFVSPIFALNPAFWFLSDRIRRFREYTCDAAFLGKGGIAAREYCHLLLDIAARNGQNNSQKPDTAYAVSVPFFGRDGIFNRSGKSALRKRILALSHGATFVDDGVGRFVNLVPAALLFIAVSAGVLLSAKPADWSHDRLMLSTVVNLERLDRINGFGVAPYR